MSGRRFGDVRQLIHDLLNRYESNPRATRVLAYIDEDAFPSVETRDRFTQALLAAEKTGGLSVQRKRIDGSTVFGHVRLADPATLYAYIGRVPMTERVDAALREAQARQDLPASAQGVLDEIGKAWSRGVGRFGLAPYDDVNLAAALDLTRALEERAGDSGSVPVDFRTFSRTAGTDSKALERLIEPVSKLFERLYPDRTLPASLDAEDRLATLGVLRTPQPLTVSGPVAIAGLELPPMRFYGIPPEQGDELGLASPVNHVLTIENYTSFVRHVREINTDRSGLVIYTGGFPSRSHLRQIIRLAEASQAPVYHWGDLDGGGVRIFRHLERAISERGLVLLPHLMDPPLLQERGVRREKQLRDADAPPSYSAVRSLWDALVSSNLSLEQESLTPRNPIKD